MLGIALLVILEAQIQQQAYEKARREEACANPYRPVNLDGFNVWRPVIPPGAPTYEEGYSDGLEAGMLLEKINREGSV